jgi:ubiquinone/menaquinone biosynthesis C-methylase UbiE
MELLKNQYGLTKPYNLRQSRKVGLPSKATLIFPQIENNSTDNFQQILQMIMNYRAAKVLFVAAYYDIFSIIKRGKNTVRRVCLALKTVSRPTQILLDTLVCMGFLQKNGDSYNNTSLSENILVKGSPNYIGNNLTYQELLCEAWCDLRNVLKKGKTSRPLEYWLFQHKTFFKEYILAMHNIAEKPAREIAGLLSIKHAKTLLDIGAGPGTYALAFLNKNKSLKAVLIDLPSSIKVARNILSNHPAMPRIEFKNGNYNQISFGTRCFDIILMSHITHNEDAKVNLRLLKKAFSALRPGGLLVLHDFMLDRNKTNPLFDALFSVHMVVSTKMGQTYSIDEYSSWIQEAGFVDLRKYKICKESLNASQVLIATRA